MPWLKRVAHAGGGVDQAAFERLAKVARRQPVAACIEPQDWPAESMRGITIISRYVLWAALVRTLCLGFGLPLSVPAAAAICPKSPSRWAGNWHPQSISLPDRVRRSVVLRRDQSPHWVLPAQLRRGSMRHWRIAWLKQ